MSACNPATQEHPINQSVTSRVLDQSGLTDQQSRNCEVRNVAENFKTDVKAWDLLTK